MSSIVEYNDVYYYDWYNDLSLEEYGNIDSTRIVDQSYGYYHLSDFGSYHLGTSYSDVMWEDYDPYLGGYLKEAYIETNTYNEITHFDANANYDSGPGHGDWVLESFFQQLVDYSSVEIVAIDLDFTSFYDGADLFGNNSAVFDAIYYDAINRVYDADNTYILSVFNASFGGHAPPPAAVDSFVNDANAFVAQASANVSQSGTSWSQSVNNVINVGAWNVDLAGNSLGSELSAIEFNDIYANGYVEHPEWGSNFGTSFAAPRVSAEIVNMFDTLLSPIIEHGLTQPDPDVTFTDDEITSYTDTTINGLSEAVEVYINDLSDFSSPVRVLEDHLTDGDGINPTTVPYSTDALTFSIGDVRYYSDGWQNLSLNDPLGFQEFQAADTDDFINGISNAIIFGGDGNDQFYSKFNGYNQLFVGGEGSDTYTISSAGFMTVYDAGIGNHGGFDRVETSGIGLFSETSYVATVDNRHLFGFDIASQQNVLIIDYMEESSRIESATFSDGTYTFDEIVSHVAQTPNYLGNLTWSDIPTDHSPNEINAQLDYYRDFYFSTQITNSPPEFDLTPQDMVAIEDASFSYQLTASDVDASDTSDSLTYSGLSTPQWMNITSSGLVSGTPSNDDVGTHTVTAQVTDSYGSTDEVTFTVTVNNVNDDPTGELAITGEAHVGWVLSAVNNISDEDGINTADNAGKTSFQWFADDVAIDGAVGNSYEISEGDLNKEISLQYNYTDNAGNDHSVFSNKTASVVAAPIMFNGHTIESGADLSGADLSGAHLSGVDLSGADLSGATLGDINLSGANLSGANLEQGYSWGPNTNLSSINLSGATLTNAIIVSADLNGADLSSAELSNTFFNGSNLAGANLNGSNLSGAGLVGVNLDRASLENSNLLNADLSGANLINANLSGAEFTGTNLQGAYLIGAIYDTDTFTDTQLDSAILSLADGNLSNSSLTGHDLGDFDLSSADFNGANFVGTNLSSANFANSDLSQANLHKANLIGANFTGANLQGAYLIGAIYDTDTFTENQLDSAILSFDDPNLRLANLANTDLQGIDLAGVNLSNANLERANLSGANLNSANLSDAAFYGANLTHSILKDAILTNSSFGYANLSGADLTGSDFTGASLFRAYLNDANLAATDLTDVNFMGADLTGANLANATYVISDNFTQEQLDSAVIDGSYVDTYWLSGMVTSPGGGLISDVTITGDVAGTDTNLSTTSSDQGSFILEAEDGIDLTVIGDLDYVNARPTKAITAQDALDALRLAVGLDTTSGSKDAFSYIAADFNQSGKVTAQDALEILKYAVGLKGQDAEWKFFDSGGDYSGISRSSTNFDEGVTAQNIASNLDMSMTGILLGDVNDTYSTYLDII